MDVSGITTLIATFLQFAAVTLASYAMLKGRVFKKSSGYIGIVCSILALLFIPSITLGSMMLAGLFNIGGFVFLVIWSIIVGLSSDTNSIDLSESNSTTFRELS